MCKEGGGVGKGRCREGEQERAFWALAVLYSLTWVVDMWALTL